MKVHIYKCQHDHHKYVGFMYNGDNISECKECGQILITQREDIRYGRF